MVPFSSNSSIADADLELIVRLRVFDSSRLSAKVRFSHFL